MTTQLDRLMVVERGHIPSSSYRRKSESWLMKFLGFVLKPFNPKFMTDFTTTIGTTTYFPDVMICTVLGDVEPAVDIECHEWVHKWDYHDHPIKFTLGYLFSRRYRRDAELRGYTMSLFVYWLRNGVVWDPQRYVKYFTGSDYLWMEKDGTYVLKELQQRQYWFESGQVDKFFGLGGSGDMEPYRIIKDFFDAEAAPRS